MPQKVPAIAFAHHLARHGEDAMCRAQVEPLPSRNRRAEHPGGVEDLVGDQRRRAEDGEVDIAALDNLDRRKDFGYGVCGRRAAGRSGGQIPT